MICIFNFGNKLKLIHLYVDITKNICTNYIDNADTFFSNNIDNTRLIKIVQYGLHFFILHVNNLRINKVYKIHLFLLLFVSE